MSLPTLSIGMTIYNRAPFIPKALNAILAQSFQPNEVIIVDDGSTDQSVEIIESYIEKYPIFHLYKNGQNRGLAIPSTAVLKKLQVIISMDFALKTRYYPGFTKSL